jgi:hypothetical protein
MALSDQLVRHYFRMGQEFTGVLVLDSPDRKVTKVKMVSLVVLHLTIPLVQIQILLIRVMVFLSLIVRTYQLLQLLSFMIMMITMFLSTTSCKRLMILLQQSRATSL